MRKLPTIPPFQGFPIDCTMTLGDALGYLMIPFQGEIISGLRLTSLTFPHASPAALVPWFSKIS